MGKYKHKDEVMTHFGLAQIDSVAEMKWDSLTQIDYYLTIRSKDKPDWYGVPVYTKKLVNNHYNTNSSYITHNSIGKVNGGYILKFKISEDKLIQDIRNQKIAGVLWGNSK